MALTTEECRIGLALRRCEPSLNSLIARSPFHMRQFAACYGMWETCCLEIAGAISNVEERPSDADQFLILCGMRDINEIEGYKKS